MEIENLEFKKTFYCSLNERQRRHFSAIEAKNLCHGGIKTVCAAFSIDPVTVRIGIRELTEGAELPVGRIRRAGGGRKKILAEAELPKIFAQVVEDYTAGNPCDKSCKWVGLRPLELRQMLRAHDYEVSDYIVHKLRCGTDPPQLPKGCLLGRSAAQGRTVSADLPAQGAFFGSGDAGFEHRHQA